MNGVFMVERAYRRTNYYSPYHSHTSLSITEEGKNETKHHGISLPRRFLMRFLRPFFPVSLTVPCRALLAGRLSVGKQEGVISHLKFNESFLFEVASLFLKTPT